MSLIEHLERPDWQDFLRGTFDYTLTVLKEDPFRVVGSAADDLRSWFVVGGVARVRQALEVEMAARRLNEDRRVEVRRLVDALADEHRPRILELVVAGAIAANASSLSRVLGLDAEELDSLIARIQAGERPFEDWMYAHGHSNEEIAAVYASVDKFLVRHGILPGPPPPWKPRVSH